MVLVLLADAGFLEVGELVRGDEGFGLAGGEVDLGEVTFHHEGEVLGIGRPAEATGETTDESGGGVDGFDGECFGRGLVGVCAGSVMACEKRESAESGERRTGQERPP